MVLRKELGEGETAVITLALKVNADLVVLDDLAARNVAAELGLSVTGTLGVLLAAYKKGYIPDLNNAISELKASGFRLSESMSESILQYPHPESRQSRA